MFGRSVMIAALVVYIGVMLGCVLNAPPEVSAGENQVFASRTVELPMRGVAVQLNRLDWMETEYPRVVDEIKDLGADTVLFVVTTRQHTVRSSSIYIDARTTPEAGPLGKLIDYAHSKGLHVVLMPIVLLDKSLGPTDWRGMINPDDWGEWFQSYREMIWYYASIAESHKVDVLVVGSELVSTESHAAEWTETIRMVRKYYKGMITYSSNWDHYKDIPFWDQLDLIGMNSYWTLGQDHTVSVNEIVASWKGIQESVLSFAQRKRKPLVLLEAGWCSVQNAASEPWDYTRDDIPLDLDLQKKLYEGFFKAWYGVKNFGGFMVWEWPVSSGGPENRGYTPKNKPAEKVLREWLKKPWHEQAASER